MMGSGVRGRGQGWGALRTCPFTGEAKPWQLDLPVLHSGTSAQLLLIKSMEAELWRVRALMRVLVRVPGPSSLVVFKVRFLLLLWLNQQA